MLRGAAPVHPVRVLKKTHSGADKLSQFDPLVHENSHRKPEIYDFRVPRPLPPWDPIKLGTQAKIVSS